MLPDEGRQLMTPTQQLIAQVWRELLEVDAVKADDVFLELGGNSLTAGMVANQLQEAVGYRPTMAEIFRGTLADLAARVDAALGKG